MVCYLTCKDITRGLFCQPMMPPDDDAPAVRPSPSTGVLRDTCREGATVLTGPPAGNRATSRNDGRPAERLCTKSRDTGPDSTDSPRAPIQLTACPELAEGQMQTARPFLCKAPPSTGRRKNVVDVNDGAGHLSSLRWVASPNIGQISSTRTGWPVSKDLLAEMPIRAEAAP